MGPTNIFAPVSTPAESIFVPTRCKGLEFRAVANVGCDVGLLLLRSVLNGFPNPVECELFVEQERGLLYIVDPWQGASDRY